MNTGPGYMMQPAQPAQGIPFNGPMPGMQSNTNAPSTVYVEDRTNWYGVGSPVGRTYNSLGPGLNC